MMRRVLLGMGTPLAGALAGWLLADPRPAQAQACGGASMNIELEEIDGTPYEGDDIRPVNEAECRGGTVLQFLLTNTGGLSSGTANSFEVFYDNEGNSNDCSSGSIRRPETEPAGGDNCVHVSSLDLNSDTMQTLTVTLSPEICGIEDGAVLNDARRGLWFLPMEGGSGSGEDVSNPYCHELRVDTDPPDPPSGLNRPEGEASLDLTWDTLNEETIRDYLVYVDTEAEGSGADPDAGADGCGSTRLVSGQIPDGDPYDTVRQGATGSVAISVSDLGLQVGDVAAVAVAARDDALNIGPLSEVSCMFVVKTTGFWDLYDGDAEQGCSVSPLTDDHLAATIPGLWVLAGLLARARARRRKA